MSREELITHLKLAKYHVTNMAERFGVERSTLAYYLKRLNIKCRPKLRYHTDEELLLATAEANTIRELEQDLGYSSEFIKRIFNDRGLEWPYKKEKMLSQMDPDVMQAMYREVGYSWNRVAQKLGVCRTIVDTFVQENGLESVKGTTLYPWTKEMLEHLYITCEMGSVSIARVLREKWKTNGPTPKTVLNALNRFGIPTRDSEQGHQIRNKHARRNPDGTMIARAAPDIPEPSMTDEAWLAEPME